MREDGGSGHRQLIIGGTNKAGTTSVFGYLCGHPEVCGSSVKETAFFIRDFTGEPERDRTVLAKYFAHCGPGERVLVEASTGYLAEAERVAPRIKSLLVDPRLMFILRAPAERLFSYYNFHVGQLSIPAELSFEDYVRLSMNPAGGGKGRASLPADSRHLRALEYGNYAKYLAHYYEQFPSERIEVKFFEDLRRDPERFMRAVSRFAGIDEDYFAGFDFTRRNVTFSSRNAPLHRIAVNLNKALEPLLRRRSGVKGALVSFYKKFNMAREGYAPMSARMRRELVAYYEPDMRKLESMLGTALPPNWRS